MKKFEIKEFNRNVSDEDLLADLRKVGAELGADRQPLTFRAYNLKGRFSSGTQAERFGSWNVALERAGIVPTSEKSIPNDALFDNLREIWMTKGEQPSFRDMNRKPSRYSASTYAERFGGWRNALKQFVVSVEDSESIPELKGQPEQVPPSAKDRNNSRGPSLRLRFLVMRRDNFKCVKCGRSPATELGVVLEVDHTLAWSKGGMTVMENLQTLCFDCNRSKSDENDVLNDAGMLE